MQSSHELFYEEFAVRFLIFFKEMATFCEQFIQKQHQPQAQPLSRNSKSTANNPNANNIQKRRKESVDPDAPKRPLSSFILFYRDKMSEYQTKNPSLSMTENTKVIGKVWNNLSEEERNEYKQKAQDLKEAYEKDYAAYALKKGITVPQKRKTKSNANLNKKKPLINEKDDEIEMQEINNEANNEDIVEVGEQEENDDDELSDSDEELDDNNNNSNKNSGDDDDSDDDSDDDDDSNASEDQNQDQELNELPMKKTGNIKDKKKLLSDSDEDEQQFQIKKKVKQQ